MMQPTANQLRIHELDCVVVDPVSTGFEPQGVVVLCHGFGAPPTDLVDCSLALWQLQPEKLHQTRFLFPAAPIQLDGGGFGDSRAWWMIDIDQLNSMIARGEFRDLRQQCPELLPQRRQELLELIDELLDRYQLDYSRLVLGGFSQGSMLATDVALHLPKPCGGLIVWSGTLMNEVEWDRAAKRNAGRFPIFMSHGRNDPVLPFTGATWLHQFLEKHGFEVTFCEFNGMHEIPMPAMRGAGELLANVLG